MRKPELRLRGDPIIYLCDLCIADPEKEVEASTIPLIISLEHNVSIDTSKISSRKPQTLVRRKASDFRVLKDGPMVTRLGLQSEVLDTYELAGEQSDLADRLAETQWEIKDSALCEDHRDKYADLAYGRWDIIQEYSVLAQLGLTTESDYKITIKLSDEELLKLEEKVDALHKVESDRHRLEKKRTLYSQQHKE